MTKFTIIIPTRERADTLLSTIKTCVEQDYENLEIIISDNFSSDNTRDVVNEFSDSRIRYYKTPVRLSMSENWDFALDKVNEGYVSIIGDDDGIAPRAIKNVAAIIDEYKVDAINSKDKAIYFWPGYIDENLQGTFNLSMSDTFKILNTQKMFRHSFNSIKPFNLPQLYHGFVKASIIKNLAADDKRVFKSSSPDIYSAVLLGWSVKKHIQSNYPFTIHGLSHHSIGTSYALPHKNSAAAKQFLSEESNLSNKKIVMSSSATTIIADAFLCASEHLSHFPTPDIKKIITLTVKEAQGKPQKEIYDFIVDAVLQTARINGMEAHARKMVSNFPFRQPVAEIEKKDSGYLSSSETLVLQSKNFGAKNIYDIFKLMKDLIAVKPQYYFSKPFVEPIEDLLKREFIFICERVTKKLTGK